MNLVKFASFLVISLIPGFIYAGESNYKKAGILLYKHENTTTYFLVGYNGKNLDYLSSFYNPDDHDLLTTAARGFNEKTMFRFSAGPRPNNEIYQIYTQKKNSDMYNNAIRDIIQKGNSDRLFYVDSQGIEQMIYLIPMEKMPYHEPASGDDSEARPSSLLNELNTQVTTGRTGGISEYVLLEKTNLYNNLKNTYPGIPVSVNAPLHKKLDRKIVLSPFLTSVLRYGISDKGMKGLQAVMP